MGLFDSLTGGGTSGGKMRPSPAEEFLGPALFAVDCRGSNLYVHENAVVIDKTGGGLWNMGDNNFKVIPFKSIIAIQAKLRSTLINGYIEFETANSPLSIGSDKANAPAWREMIVIITARYAGAFVFIVLSAYFAYAGDNGVLPQKRPFCLLRFHTLNGAQWWGVPSCPRQSW